MITDVTIISTSLNKKILDNYKDYHIIDKSFTYEELLQYKSIIFFNILSNLKDKEIKKLYQYLKDNSINYINATNNIEEVLFTKNLVVYDKEKIIMEGSTLSLLNNAKLFKRLGFNLPFIIDLSLYLKDYNLVDKIYLDKESLVDDLWK